MRQHEAQGQVSRGEAAVARGQEVTKGSGLQSSNSHGGYWKGTPRPKQRQQIHCAQCWHRNRRLGSSRLGEAQSHRANLNPALPDRESHVCSHMLHRGDFSDSRV